MASQENVNEKRGCIELVKCVSPTPEQRNDPHFIPQLKINEEAQAIIAERFKAPISIIVFVGNMGVGKSKLATVTVAALEKERHDPSLRWFQSGDSSGGVTKGVWMWREPVQHPNDTENKKGSILVLDCEGMGDLDENTGANLYLFCMIMSTAFAVVLRPARIEKNQCDRLYHALRRFENMRTQHVLPNFWLIPLGLSDFVRTDPNGGDDVVISKEQWTDNIFKVDEEKNILSNIENRQLKARYEHITRMLPKIDAIQVDHLPASLMKNVQKLDVYTLLRQENSASYLESINNAIRALLASGGKRFPGSTANKMFLRPAELASFMGDLIKVINKDKLPNPDSLFEKYLAERFIAEIERENLAAFKEELLNYANEVVRNELGKLQKPQTETEIARMNASMKKKHKDTTVMYKDCVIRQTRYQILGLDQSFMNEFMNASQRDRALEEFPLSIRHRLNIMEIHMNEYQESERLIQQAQQNLTIADVRRQRDAMQNLYEEAKRKLDEQTVVTREEQLINESLDREDAWRVGAAPCSCGAHGGAYNMLHKNCRSKEKGNLYYFNDKENRMVCDACRKVIKCEPDNACCNRCGKRLDVTRIY